MVARCHGHALSTPRPLWAEGQRPLLRLLGDVRQPARHRSRQGVPGRRLRARRQLLRQRRGLRRRRVGAHHGPGHRRPRLAPARVRAQHEAVLGHPRRAQHAQHAEPQVPPARRRRFAGAPRRRARRHPLLPPRRPRDEHRGDDVGDERHRQLGPGALLGDLGVDGRRDPSRVGDRRAPPPAQARRRAAAVQPAAPQEVERELPEAVRGHRARPDDVEPARLRAADRQVPGGRPGGQPGDPAGLRVAAPRPHRPRGQRQGPRPRRHRGRARLLAHPPGHRVVRGEPRRVDGDHRRQPSGAGRREPVRPRRRSIASTRPRWPASTRWSAAGPEAEHDQASARVARRPSGEERKSNVRRRGALLPLRLRRASPAPLAAVRAAGRSGWRPRRRRALRRHLRPAPAGDHSGERRRRPRHAGLPLVDRGRCPPVAGRRRADLRDHDGGRRLRALPRPGGPGRRPPPALRPHRDRRGPGRPGRAPG